MREEGLPFDFISVLVIPVVAVRSLSLAISYKCLNSTMGSNTNLVMGTPTY
jgi:hypothetical protein